MGCADYRIDCNGDSDGDRGSDLRQSANEAVESCRNAHILGTDLHGFK